MADYYAFQGDSLAVLSETLGVDTTGYSTVFFIAKEKGTGGDTIEKEGSIDVAGTGEVSVQLTASELTRTGTYDCAWRLETAGGATWTLPADTVKTLQVRRKLV